MKARISKITCYLVGLWVLSSTPISLIYAQEYSSHKSEIFQQKPSCKAKNFDVFYKRFTENIDMQKLCTHFPLQKLELVEEQGDLVPKLVKLTREQITYPLILTQQEQKEQVLNLKILMINNKTAKVTLYKPDAGYQVIYRFKKKKTWKLIKIEDWSV